MPLSEKPLVAGDLLARVYLKRVVLSFVGNGSPCVSGGKAYGLPAEGRNLLADVQTVGWVVLVLWTVAAVLSYQLTPFA